MSIRRTDALAPRTAEERERARQERERRRLERQGLPVPEPQPVAGDPPLPEPDLPPLPESDLPSMPDPDLRRMPEPDLPPMPESDLPSMSEPDLRRMPEPGLPLLGEPDPPPLPEPDPPPLPDPDPQPDPAPPHRSPLGKSHLHRPHLHRPHLHRPHLGHPHVSRPRSLRARLGAIASLLIVLAALAAGALVIERHIRHKPIPGPAIVSVVIPEGSTRPQIAELARADGLRGDYEKAVASSTQLRLSRYGTPTHEHGLEGFLFPATYELYAGAPVSKLLSDQLDAFAESFGVRQIASAKALGVTPYELLIVASMVEREASLSRERPLVAAVIYNRLRQRMPLGIDATIRYALHDYTQPLTEAQLHSSSPYNTRTHSGLPPTPISNPGRASIEAAAHPAHVSYLYYVARADGCAGQVFSTSYSQFQRDAAAYQNALRRNHGRVPTCRSR